MNFVIIDDHPFISEGYSTVIQQNFLKSNVVKLASCKEVYNYFVNNPEAKRIDIALVDFNIPAYEEKKLHNGIDLTKLIRSIIPYCKIIMLTAHTEKIYILDIIKNAKPNGFITKGELTPEILKMAIECVSNHDKHYSEIIKQTYAESLDEKSLFDDYNRQILYLLSKGYKIIELDKIIPISYSTIQKRIAKMKQVLKVDDDKGLIKAAIKEGYLS